MAEAEAAAQKGRGDSVCDEEDEDTSGLNRTFEQAQNSNVRVGPVGHMESQDGRGRAPRVDQPSEGVGPVAAGLVHGLDSTRPVVHPQPRSSEQERVLDIGLDLEQVIETVANGPDPEQGAHDAFKEAHGLYGETVQIRSQGVDPAVASDLTCPKLSDRVETLVLGQGRHISAERASGTRRLNCHESVRPSQQQVGFISSGEVGNEGEKRKVSAMESIRDGGEGDSRRMERVYRRKQVALLCSPFSREKTAGGVFINQV